MRLSDKDKEEVRTIITEEINKLHDIDHAKLISDAVKDAIKPLHDEIANLRELLEETREQNQSLQAKLFEKNVKIANLEQTLTTATQRNVTLHSLILEKSDDNETYSRKDSLRVSGIEFDPDEDNVSLQQNVITKLDELGVRIEDRDIYRLHRSSKPQPMNNYKKYLNKVNSTPVEIDPHDNTETSKVIVRFSRWAPRARVYALHYKKDLAIKVKCDLTKYRQDLLKDARQYLFEKSLKGYCFNTAECKLCLKNVSTGRKSYFSNFAEFKTQAAALIEDPLFHRQQR